MKKLNLLFITLIFAVACGNTGETLQRPHEHLDFPELKEFNIPEVERFTYNGIEFFLLQDDELPLVNVRVIVNGGSWMDPTDKVGRASLTGTVLRSGGSEQYPEEELNELLENRAASMESSFGLATGSARMDVLQEDFHELLPVFTDWLNNPLLPEERLDLAKTQQQTAISRRNEEGSNVASREFRKLIYGPESVYARIIEYETLANITREDIVSFHAETYQGSNMMVGVIGDFDPEAVREQLKEAFGVFEEGTPVDMDMPEVDYEFEDGYYFAHKGDMNQSQIRMGHIGGYRDNPDYAALQVMNQILSGGFSGRLMQRVRTEQGLAYGVYGNYSSNVRYPGVFFAGLSTAAESTKKAMEATMEQIRLLQEEKVSEAELEETKDRIFNRIIFRYDSYARILNEQMQNYNLGLPEDAFEQYIEEVREVTVEDIHRVANEYLQPENMKVLIVGNRDLIDDQLEEIGDITEVDITIPRPAAERAAVEGDAEAGAMWLEKMASSILDDRPEFEAIVMEGSQYIQTPQGEMAVEITSRTQFPANMNLQISTPMGSQEIDISGGSGVVRMGGQEQRLPESAVESMMDDLKRNPLNLAMNAAQLEALLIDSGENEDLLTLYIAGDYDVTLHIDPELELPVKMEYSRFDPDQGRNVDVTLTLDNWTLKDGVRVAYDQKSHADGEVQSRTEYTDHTIE
ncbi:M16 family metallopeptidase [Natronogracilivirga saccharolytica]|uniref:Insulinase family protein n=1 Tax=Natronogracilivirga saccharolytica TaxID=2812953 RepID=A0A8J7RK50_9BACT|nr:pitrilysin family protein [Natronogracilivirga saccharolytica]MBP3191134.1 insulinase family protein [Natronogracilivirga saccharolytica]